MRFSFSAIRGLTSRRTDPHFYVALNRPTRGVPAAELPTVRRNRKSVTTNKFRRMKKLSFPVDFLRDRVTLESRLPAPSPRNEEVGWWTEPVHVLGRFEVPVQPFREFTNLPGRTRRSPIFSAKCHSNWRTLSPGSVSEASANPGKSAGIRNTSIMVVTSDPDSGEASRFFTNFLIPAYVR